MHLIWKIVIVLKIKNPGSFCLHPQKRRIEPITTAFLRFALQLCK